MPDIAQTPAQLETSAVSDLQFLCHEKKKKGLKLEYKMKISSKQLKLT